jgi:hypothetical protein
MNRKCGGCGLVNFAVSETCRRCGAILEAPAEIGSPTAGTDTSGGDARPAFRVFVIAGTVAALLFVWWGSLFMTSDGLDADQRGVVTDAIGRLEAHGFSHETILLRYFTSFRATDNWWNEYVGHQKAYAATNFPFEVVTLYPPFFSVAKDDTERAIILLHEAQHLLGRDEEAALSSVWHAKRQLGWTDATYGRTRVWKNTKEWTQASAPRLFTCGTDSRSDCLE